MPDTSFSKPSHTNGPIIKLYDLGTSGPYAEAAAMLGWDSVGLQWVKVKVDSSGQVFTVGGTSTGGGGGQQYIELSTVGTTGTGNLILGHDVGGIARVPTVGSFANSTAMAVQIVDASGNQITAFSGGTTTVVQGTASNFNATVTGTVAATQSGGWSVTVSQAAGTNLHVVVDNGTITTVPSGTQPISYTPGTTPVTQVTSPWVVDDTTTNVPSGTQTIVGTTVISGIGSSSSVFDTSLTQALPVMDNDLISRLDQLLILQSNALDAQMQLVESIRPIAQVGPRIIGDGVWSYQRLGKTGELITGNAHAPYQEAVLRGNVFTAVNAASVSLSVAQPIVGLIIYNPANSGKNFVFIRAITKPSAIGALNICNIYTSTSVVGAPTGTTTDGFVSNSIGVPTNSAALVYSTASFAQASTLLVTLVRAWQPSNVVIGTAVATGTALNQVGGFYIPEFVELYGLYVLTPGNFALIGFLDGGNCGLMWEEVPI